LSEFRWNEGVETTQTIVHEMGILGVSNTLSPVDLELVLETISRRDENRGRPNAILEMQVLPMLPRTIIVVIISHYLDRRFFSGRHQRKGVRSKNFRHRDIESVTRSGVDECMNILPAILGENFVLRRVTRHVRANQKRISFMMGDGFPKSVQPSCHALTTKLVVDGAFGRKKNSTARRKLLKIELADPTVVPVIVTVRFRNVPHIHPEMNRVLFILDEV
jgi:hypothetical protein